MTIFQRISLRAAAPVAALLCLMSVTVSPVSGAPGAQSGEGIAAGVIPELLAATAFDFEDVGDDVWLIPYTGDALEEFWVSVSAYGDLVLTQAFVTDPPELDPEKLRRLLRLSYNWDLAKVGLDPEGDLGILNETEAATLDAVALEWIIESVASLADEVAGMVAGDAPDLPEFDESESARALDGEPPRGMDTTRLLTGIELGFDPDVWKAEDSEDPGSFNWVHSDGDVYFKVIAERYEISYPSMLEIVVSNAEATADQVRVTRQGFRRVNGERMMWLEMDADISGIAFTFYSHVYSGPSGTIQLHAWTGRNLIDEYRESIEDMVSQFRLVSAK